MASESLKVAEFVFEKALAESVRNEHLYEQEDLGPTDRVPLEQLDHLCRWFYGTSPLSSAPSSPSASRPSSPHREELSRLPQHSVINDAAPPIPQHIPPAAVNSPKEGPHGSTSQKRRNKEKSKQNRKRGRQEEKRPQDAPYHIKEGPCKKFTASPHAAKTSYDADSIPTNTPGYTAPLGAGGRIYTYEELVEKMGFTPIPYKGKSSWAITDSFNRIIGVFAGEPEEATWAGVPTGAAEAIERHGRSVHFTTKTKKHRRGRFGALSFGISHGGGQQQPGNIHHDPPNAEALAALTKDEYITRIAGFGSSIFATWAPKLYTHYEENFNAVLDNDKTLRRNWDKSIWASFAINFGPRTVCHRHRDNANLPFGWCSITALGDFDWKKGGHLVLWEAKLVIEFPPGSTILIPSSAISHSNTPIARNEKRYSFTQYTAGGLFRWVDQGFQPTPSFVDGLTEEGMKEEKRRQRERCKLGLSLFSTLSSLSEDQKARNARL